MQRKQHQLLIGFAAETNDVLEYAKGKLIKKNADYIIANDVSKVDRGFGTDTNTVTLIGREDYQQSYKSVAERRTCHRVIYHYPEREKVYGNDCTSYC